MYGRTDFEKYFSACEKLENWVILPQGGITRRPGTKFVAPVKNHTEPPVLLPFQFSDSQGYVLEFGKDYLRFFRDSGQIVAENIGIAIANGTFNTDLASWTERNAGTGDVTWVAGAARFTANGVGNEARLYQAPTIAAPDVGKLHILKFRVVVGTLRVRVGTAAGGEQVMQAKTFAWGYHTVSFTPSAAVQIFIEFENNGTVIADLDNVSLLDNVPLELETPYSNANLPEIQYDQSADTMWLALQPQKPMKLLRFSDNDWSLVMYTPVGDPFTLLLNGRFDKDLLEWVERNDGTGDVVYDTTDKRARLQSGSGANLARLYQTAPVVNEPHILRFDVFDATITLRVGTTIGGTEVVGSTNFAVGQHTVAFTPPAGTIFVEFEGPASTNPELDNVALDASSGASVTQSPRAVAFWRSRLWWGGTDREPQAVWATHVDNFDNLDPGTGLDDQAIKRVIAGGRINVIQWLMPSGAKELLVGTYGSEMLLRGDSGGLVTPAKVTIDEGTQLGSAPIRPERADNFTIFIQRGRQRLRQFFFDFNTDKNHATDLTLIADHITKPALKSISYQGDPEPVLWAVREDGQLPGLTFMFHEKVAGWHRQVTQGKFEEIAVIPHENGDRDQLWVIARRLLPVPNVTGVANNGSGLIRITTASAHGLATGEQVDIAGVLGAPAANGTWIVTNFDSTHFDLDGSVFSGTYTSGGTVGKVRRYVEFLDDVDGFYSRLNTDSGLTATFGSPASAVGNLGHLEGLEVDIVGDGAVYPRKIVTAGEVPLDGPTALVVEVGLPYKSTCVTLRPEASGGTIQGVTVARGDITIRVIDTPVLSVNGDPLPDRSSEDDMDEALPLFSGDLVVPALGWGSEAGKIEIVQDMPLPATVTLLAGAVAIGDE